MPSRLRYSPLLALLALCGCEGFSIDITGPVPGPPPPPPAEEPVAGPYDHLPSRTSFSPKSDVELRPGFYSGDFVLGSSQIDVVGAGLDQTVIHGNLVLQTQCKVSNLTVLGDVVFEGHQARLIDVDFRGRIVDNGLQNQY